MINLQNERILLTGGGKGLGRAVVKALVALGAMVTVVARDKTLLNEAAGTNVLIVDGDVTDKVLIEKVIGDLQPTLLILNAGATPVMAPMDEQDWESFSAVWNTDVKAGLFGIQAALKTPVPPGGRVMIVSSGAAWGGSPLSGGYAGAKRMLWPMAKYANEMAIRRSHRIHFQVVLPTQIIGETDFGQHSASAIAQSRNMTIENYLAAGNGKPFSAKEYADYFVKLLTDINYADGIAYSINYDGITKLE